jgi:hypothetical protein
MFNKIFSMAKGFFRFLIEKPGANMDWKWSVGVPYGSYDGSLTNNQDSFPAQDFQGFGAKDWAPAEIGYYSNKNNDSTDSGSDVWTPEKLIAMSGALGQAYGVPLQNDLNDEQ